MPPPPKITDQVTAKNAEVRRIGAAKREAQTQIRTASLAVRTAETELSKRKASPEPLAQEPKLQRKLSQHLDKLAALVLEYTALMRSTKDDMLKFTAAELASEEAAMVERHQKQQDTAVTDRLDNLAAEVQRAKDDFHNAKQVQQHRLPLCRAALKRTMPPPPPPLSLGRPATEGTWCCCVQHAQALRDKASREAPMPENEEEVRPLSVSRANGLGGLGRDSSSP